MTKEGRLARGKENHERGRFPDNQETIDYVKTLKKGKQKVEEIPEEVLEELPKEEESNDGSDE